MKPDFPPVSEDPRERLKLVLNALGERGYRAYFVNLTTPDVAQLGLTVGRSLVPGLHPLACGPRNYTLDDRRLRRVADHWGMPMPAALNTEPHPFP